MEVLINDLNWAEWDVKTKYRGLHIKFPEQLDWLKNFYPEKIIRLLQMIEELKEWGKQENHDDIKFLREKVKRLEDKEKATIKEIEGRKLGHFKRDPHGTLYYIDLDAGNDGNTGLTILLPWLTLAQYTTTTVRNPGDIAKVRAATDELMAIDLVFDEDGDIDDYIEIRGCSIVDDPWSDGSDVKPILTFGDNNNQAHLEGDNFWKFNRMIIKESADVWGNLRLSSVGFCYILDCELTDNSNAAGRGSTIGAGSLGIFENCIFKDNIGINLKVDGGIAKLINCALDGGVTTTDYGLYLKNAKAECVDCDFGQTTDHDVSDIELEVQSMAKLRNCNLGVAGVSLSAVNTIVYEEDADAVYGAFKETYYQGINTKDTTIKTGGATFSMKMQPNAFCGANNPLTLNNDSLINYPFNILCTTGVERTITIKIRSVGAWATYPTASELYIEFKYLSDAVTAERTAIASVQVLSHASDWVEFTVTFTPLQTGIAYGAVYLGKYEDAGDGCYVNWEAT